MDIRSSRIGCVHGNESRNVLPLSFLSLICISLGMHLSSLPALPHGRTLFLPGEIDEKERGEKKCRLQFDPTLTFFVQFF